MSFFGFYDALNCAAVAVDESESGKPDAAVTAYLNAVFAADGLFLPAADAQAALVKLLDAAAPAEFGQPGRALLFNALNAASLAVLPAMTGDGPNTSLLLADLEAAASLLAPELRDAMTVIADEIGLLAMTAVAA